MVPAATAPAARGLIMALKHTGTIAIPDSEGSAFDHGAFDPRTRRIFVTHTRRSSVEVIDHDKSTHVATLPGFAEAAGLVADEGIVLVTNRGDASMAVLDAATLKTQAVLKTGPKPNGVALVSRRDVAIAASFGDESQGPKLHVISLDGRQQYAIDLQEHHDGASPTRMPGACSSLSVNLPWCLWQRCLN